MSDACIIGQLGLIYDPGKRCFIDESAKEWIVDFKKSLYANSFSLPQKVFLKGITCSYLTLGADGGFYHFLFESVIKTEMYRSVLKQADHILFNGPLTDWKLKWVNKANIDCSKIIWVEGNAHYQCEQLLFTNKLIADQQVSKWAVNTLKEVFGISDTGNNKSITKNIIWITRKGQKNREIEWEYELLKQFPAIERVDLSLLPVDGTIAKLQYATHVIGPHGAGLSNIYLCRPGTKILEFYPNGAFFQPCYQRLSEVCFLDHTVMYLDFRNKADITLGINALTDMLNKFLC
ncbi:MAG TPA: glycosyltransferase 61 family protein [Mucilaginibacter sp.]|nr:glycosyltransferase 61 family protein [Mucilaginibacter sp.]